MTAAELRQGGVSEARVRALVRRGALVVVARGVYAVASEVREANATETGQRTVRLAAVLAGLGPGAVGSHHDAAALHGLDLLDRLPADIAVSRSPQAGGSRRGGPGVSLHVAALPRAHLAIQQRMPVTSVARTVVDVARSASFRAGVVTADSALHQTLTTTAELTAVLTACPRWPGVAKARRVVAFSDHQSESPFESIARVVFHEGGLPAPELQTWVGADEFVIGRADFLWRQHATIAEADGALKYANPERARQRLARDARLRAAGFEVVHITWAQLLGSPDYVLSSIRAAFRRSETLRLAGRGKAS